MLGADQVPAEAPVGEGGGVDELVSTLSRCAAETRVTLTR